MSATQVPEGQDVVAFLGALGAVDGTWVTGIGTMTDVVLGTLEAEGEAARELPGRIQLLSLVGPIDGPLMATVVTPDDHAVEGGRLVRGKAAGVLVFMMNPSAAAKDGKTPTRAQQTVPASDDDEADEAPRFGDRVDHFVFGLCDVMVVREERMKIRDAAAGGGRLREIHLGAVKVLKPTTVDGRRVFKLARK